MAAILEAPNPETFSILSRIVGTATCNVTHIGKKTSHFQYPQSDRGHCNPRRWPKVPRPFSLSVSSVGSWALQLRRGLLETRVCKFNFQYPQSDRGHCNGSMPKLSSPANRPFSILSRIVGTATSYSGFPPSCAHLLSVSSVGSWALQLTLYDTVRMAADELSVSSVGSWALQLARSRSAIRPLSSLSVSSVGSWALQLSVGQRSPANTTAFQYPQSDRGHCNLSPSPKRLRCWIFQYPQSDRGHCNLFGPRNL